MKRMRALVCLLAVPLLLTAGAPGRSLAAGGPAGERALCPVVAKGHAHCDASMSVDNSGRPFLSPNPVGFKPADFRSAYNLPWKTAGKGQTIGIIDAYGYANSETDLGIYRKEFRIPACTTSNGCFRKTDQNGGTNYPPDNSEWDVEQALDTEMVSAVCPNCHILLVEANDNSWTNLMAAEQEAITLGATVISNSWSGTEFSDQLTYDSIFAQAGIPIVASSGDVGYSGTVEWPASSQYVTAAGGTQLSKLPHKQWSETAWQWTESGCSQLEAKPVWQTDQGCKTRTVADVAADAYHAAVYSSSFPQAGWQPLDGTSVAAPIIAGAYALAGNGSSVQYGSYPYAHASSLHDITTGSTGTCQPPYLCNGEVGYDAPTGMGTPNGTGAF
ncbi:MAG TPA: S53 family peptidase [Chloroflexota bacterium]|nr:S53 family peptidase [Chloroflexota bacterium]